MNHSFYITFELFPSVIFHLYRFFYPPLNALLINHKSAKQFVSLYRIYFKQWDTFIWSEDRDALENPSSNFGYVWGSASISFLLAVASERHAVINTSMSKLHTVLFTECLSGATSKMFWFYLTFDSRFFDLRFLWIFLFFPWFCVLLVPV